MAKSTCPATLAAIVSDMPADRAVVLHDLGLVGKDCRWKYLGNGQGRAPLLFEDVQAN